MNSLPLAEQLKISGQHSVPLVIGGIGTESAIPYMRSLLRQNTQAEKDQDHLGYLMLVASAMPDRSHALLAKQQGDEKPYETIKAKLEEFAKFGKKEGFGFMVTICNTIHIWREDASTGLKDMFQSMGIPWISIMESAAHDLQAQYKPGTKIAVSGTTGTLFSKLYHTALENVGLVPVAPEENSALQKDIMDAIFNPEYGIKAKGATPQAVKLFSQLPIWAEEQGCVALIEGCTEIPLGLHSENYQGKIQLINPLDSLAKKTLELAFAV